MRKRAARAAILLILCPGLSFAQNGDVVSQAGPIAGNVGVPNGPSPANEQSALQLISIVLELTDSQQEHLHAYFDDAAKTAKPIADEMEHDKRVFFAAVISGKNDDEIKRLADEQAALTSQMLLLQAHTFAKLWNILSGMQKSEVDNFVLQNIQTFLQSNPQ